MKCGHGSTAACPRPQFARSRRPWAAARLLVGACLVGLLLLGGTQAQTSGSLSVAERQDAIEEARDLMDRTFLLDPALPLEVEFRRRVQAMVDAERPRLHALLPAWVNDAVADVPGVRPRLLGWVLFGRFLNESALWRLDRADADHDRLLLRLFTHPRACDPANEARAYWAGEVVRAQRLPAAERSQWLAAETTVLRRFGLPRAVVPPRPAPSHDSLADQALDDLLQRDVQPTLPWVPALSMRLLDLSADRQSPKTSQGACLMRQWALLQALQREGGQASEATALAHRYAVLPVAADWRFAQETPLSPETPYPWSAKQMQVEGRVQVQITLDARGRPLRAHVVRRFMTAPGLGGRPPVGVETLLDEASLLRAISAPYQPPAADKLLDGQARVNVEYVWRLQ